MPTSDKAHKINDLWALFFLFSAIPKTNKCPVQTKLRYQIVTEKPGFRNCNDFPCKSSTFRILFYLRKNYLNKSGKAGIMVRLTVNGDMVERKAETQTSTGVSADKTAIVEAEQEKKPKRGWFDWIFLAGIVAACVAGIACAVRRFKTGK